MLAFVTSLRHPKNSNDYPRVEQLLLETLGSVTQQTSDDFVVIVVGNREPTFDLPDKVHFVKVTYGPPAPKGERITRSPFIRDKGCKIGIGLIAAREFSPDYVMIFDADDFVHRGLAQFASENPGRDGWVVDQGWTYSRGRSAFVPSEDFNRICGTSFLMPYSVYGVPDHLDVTASKLEIREAYGERLSKIIGAHKWALEWYTARGIDVQPLPFRGSVYHVDTGENHSRNAVLTERAKPLNAELAAEYGIPVLRGRIATLWACYCSLRWAKMTAPFRPAVELAKRVYRGVRRRVGRIVRRG